MKLQVGVKLCIRDKQGKILLLRRSPEKYPETGAQWDIIGGRIDPGITLYENLKREVKEEAGFTFEKEVRLLNVQDVLRDGKKHVVRLTFIASVSKRPKIRLSEENDEYKWFSLEELNKLKKRQVDMFFKEIVDKKFIS